MNALNIVPTQKAVITQIPASTEQWFTVDQLFTKFNREMGRLLETKIPDANTLFEFIYAHDALHEIATSSSFPNNRLLNTPDTENAPSNIIRAFDDFARRSHDLTMFGCSVSQDTKRAVDEFFAGDYLLTIATAMKAIGRRSLMYTLYGCPITLSLQLGYAHPDYGVLEYKHLMSKYAVLIPFKLHRINA